MWLRVTQCKRFAIALLVSNYERSNLSKFDLMWVLQACVYGAGSRGVTKFLRVIGDLIALIVR